MSEMVPMVREERLIERIRVDLVNSSNARIRHVFPLLSGKKLRFGLGPHHFDHHLRQKGPSMPALSVGVLFGALRGLGAVLGEGEVSHGRFLVFFLLPRQLISLCQ